MRRVALLLVLVVGCGKPDPALKPADPPAGPIIEADDLFKAYKTDAVSAASQYAGKAIRVRLRVDETQQIGSSMMLIHRLRPGGSDRVQARIPLAEMSFVKSGTPVVVAGKVDYQDAVDVTLEGHVEP